MRRSMSLFALMLAVAACGGATTATTDGSDGITTTSTPTSTDPTTPVTTTLVTTTTTPPDTSFDDFIAARQALLDFIDQHGVAATPTLSGTLSPTGNFLDDFGAGGLPEVEVDVRVLVDLDGLIWFAVFGEPDVLANTWIEFDAVAADGFTVVAETSVTTDALGPEWVATAPAGSVVQLHFPGAAVSGLLNRGDQPEFPEGPGDLDGYLLIGSEITAVDGSYLPRSFNNDTPRGSKMSVWGYRDLGGLTLEELTAGAQWGFINLVLTVDGTPEPADIAAVADRYKQGVDVFDTVIGYEVVPADRGMFMFSDLPLLRE